jgi:YegS/Rv2252/BmrU family lipid kinase
MKTSRVPSQDLFFYEDVLSFDLIFCCQKSSARLFKLPDIHKIRNIFYLQPMHRKRIAFVINPKAGQKTMRNRVDYIKQLITGSSYDATIFEWKNLDDRDTIFNQVITGNYTIAVAVGGDGTVNQLAHVLCGSSTALAILPFGSGNGLARHLTIPMDIPDAVRLLEDGKIISIDRGRINGHSFFCTAGAGFDAHIGNLFAESSTRGFRTYAHMIIREFRKYRPETYRITIDGLQLQRDAMLVTVANAGQYGNNVWIAPEADIQDGWLNLVILKAVRWWNLPGLIKRLFDKTVHHSSSVETHRGKSIRIDRMHEAIAHFDGEPLLLSAQLEIDIEPAVLRVVVPTTFS